MITGAQVFIDSVDYTGVLTDVVEIEITESQARIASFTLLPGSGITDLISWTGKPVVIKSNIDSNIKTEFTGIIDTPSINIETGLTSFTCTDNLQEHFETKTKTEIDAIISGYWSEAVFNDSEGWEYAQEQLSSLPSSLDMDELNAIRVTPWAAKGTADYSFTVAGYIAETLVINQLTNRRNIINAVDIALDYRYTRLKERQLDYNLNDGLGWSDFVCNQFTNPWPVPTKSLVYSAIEQSGWQLVGIITWQDLPPSDTYQPCGVIYSNITTEKVRGASFTIGKRYAQNVTEKYTIRIESADSIAALGEIAITDSGAIQTKYDLTNWNESDINDGWSNFGIPLTDINNDSYVNKDSETDRQSALDTIINVAKTKILSTHRNNEVSFSIPYHQDIDVIHTAEINTAKLNAKGKVSRVVKIIDVVTGEAVCHVTIKLSKKIGVGTPGSEDPPAVPDGLPVAQDIQTVDMVPAYHLGGQDATPYDPAWCGWIADYTVVTEPGHTPYPTELVINTPAITLNSIDNIGPTDTSLLNVTIPDDILS